MIYAKPEITILGDANLVIQGVKNSTCAEANTQPGWRSFELED